MNIYRNVHIEYLGKIKHNQIDQLIYNFIFINYAIEIEGMFGNDFMKDPLVNELIKAFQSVFELSMRKGKFIYPEIRKLKQILHNFDPTDKKDFHKLLKILREALPRIEQWHFDFNNIKSSLDLLAQKLNLPVIDWHKYLSHSNASFHFQISVNQRYQRINLIEWLEMESGEALADNDLLTQVNMLLKCHQYSGFSKRLTTHLEKDRDFLFQLITESEDIFTRITNTRLILHLTDGQLAKAILKHLPKWLENYPDSSMPTEKIIEIINEKLSQGRSVSTLLRNKNAKTILDSSELLNPYQSSNANPIASTNPLSTVQERGLKPTL